MDGPHNAQILFTIHVFPMSTDGSLLPDMLPSEELKEFGITNKAVFNIVGYNKADCIKKVKEVLESLHYEE